MAVLPKDVGAGGSSSGTVTVGCKLPGGLILRLFEFREQPEPILGGGTKMVQMSTEVGERVIIHGCAAPHGQSPAAPLTNQGYALTFNVPAEFFENWLEQNRDMDMVRNGLIFAASSTNASDVNAKSRERDGIRSGMEPLEPDTDPRMPKRVATASRR